MAQRRMLRLDIVNSSRFLKLPIDTQNLYFHLCLRADDDGIVEAFTVARLINSSEDNLKLLHAKEFIKVLNDDLVAYITDWNSHNKIRADRKVDSIYKDLLVQILPESKIITPRPRSDVKDNSKRLRGQSLDSTRTVHGQDAVGIGKVRLGKVSIGKEDRNVAKIFQTMQEYLGSISETSRLKIQSFLDDGVESDVITEAMRDSVGKDRPDTYCINILEKCIAEKVTTFHGYIERKRQHTKKADEYKRQQQSKKATHENFDQREYTEDEMEQYYTKID